MAIVISEKMYVGYQERGFEVEDKVKLGFATYVEDNPAFEKRKETVDYWAKNQHRNEKTFPTEILDNKPMCGFKIAREVRRHGWGGGNVLWRIEDPRGFELEISSANFASIIDCCDLIKGEIQSPCIWGWNKQGGSRVVLLPEFSEPYNEALKDTKRHQQTMKISEVNIGDFVELKNGVIGTYLGSHHYVEETWLRAEESGSGYWNGNSAGTQWIPSKRKVHFFDRGNKEKLYSMSAPKPSFIIRRSGVEMTASQGAEIINRRLSERINVESASGTTFVFVHPTIIKQEDYRAFVSPLDRTKLKQSLLHPEEYSSHKSDISDSALLSDTFGNSYMIWGFDRQQDKFTLVQVDALHLLETTQLRKILKNEQNGHTDRWRPNYGQVYKPNTHALTLDEILTFDQINKIMIGNEGKLYPTIF